MTGLLPKLSKDGHYHKPTKEWVSLLYERDGKCMVRNSKNICKFVMDEDLLTYEEYIIQFFKYADNKI